MGNLYKRKQNITNTKDRKIFKKKLLKVEVNEVDRNVLTSISKIVYLISTNLKGHTIKIINAV